MRLLTILLCIASALAARIDLSGQNVRISQQQSEANYRAHAGDFDYLLGDWEFTAVSKEYGTFGGRWSAVRLAQGQLLDEYRVLDDKGQTVYVTTTLRAYNAVLDRWELVGMDSGNGLRDVGTAHRVGGEIELEQTFGLMTDRPAMMRIRYYNIGPDGFSWTSDRSTDKGKTWVKDFQRIEARRIGPSRSLGALVQQGRK
jgi:hypothetical protein